MRLYITTIFISCQVLLILLNTIGRVPDRLPRVIGKSVNALSRDF